MASGADINYAYNTFIFNWVKNYDDQVIALKDAIESLQNKVQIYNHLSCEQLSRIMDKLSQTNFELYNYIVVIILDNECEFQQFIKTADNQNVLLHSEILTRIQTNPTLNDISRLFVIQKLIDVKDIDDEDVNKIEEMIKERQNKLKKPAVLYSGLTVSISANEYSKHFTNSPFIKVFSRNFRRKAETVAMDVICKGIMREIKYKRGYEINIEFGSNANTPSNLIFGHGIREEVLRDFF